MSDLLPVLLIMLAGFLIGGAYTVRQEQKPLAVVLLALALVAGVGGVLWL